AVNKTFTRGMQSREYLLSRVLFCADCGKSLSPQANSSGLRHYRHRANTPCQRGGIKMYVNAADLEAVIIRHLFETFGNPKAVQRAVDAAVPNRAELDDLRRGLTDAEAGLAKTWRQKDRIVEQIGEETISTDEAKRQLTKLREREAAQQA